MHKQPSPGWRSRLTRHMALALNVAMPMRYIEVPAPVTLRDPATKEVLKDQDGKDQVWTFPQIINKLMSNPKWGESYAAMRSQGAIEDALTDSVKDGVMVLSEEDWTKLKEAVETPRTAVITTMGPQVFSGFGLHPMLSRQLLPLLVPIIEAPAERKKKNE
jgi:hypothetical protein